MKFLHFAFLLFISFTNVINAANISWIGGGTPWQSESWGDPQNWSTGTVPNPTDDVTISGGNIEINGDVAMNDLNLLGGQIVGSGTFTINGNFNWANEECGFGEDVNIVLSSTGIFTLETLPDYNFGRSVGGNITIDGIMNLSAGYFGTTGNFTVNGTLNWQYGNIYNNLNIGSTGILNIQGSLEGYQRLVADDLFNLGTINWLNGELRTAGNLITNNGIMNISALDNVMTGGFPALGSELFINNGTINLAAGVIDFQMDVKFINNGSLLVNGNTQLNFIKGVSIKMVLWMAVVMMSFNLLSHTLVHLEEAK
ncbi:MAG: hypothetical protein IPO92_18725 [Saprospiraceae bacterium]|nr:hypothetical protein [Saprospiraceae bacterium]